MPYTPEDRIRDEGTAGTVKRLSILIEGRNDMLDDTGLIGAVGHNSRFRKNASKILWIIATAVLVGYINWGLTTIAVAKAATHIRE